jgi:hypothetical protein
MQTLCDFYLYISWLKITSKGDQHSRGAMSPALIRCRYPNITPRQTPVVSKTKRTRKLSVEPQQREPYCIGTDGVVICMISRDPKLCPNPTSYSSPHILTPPRPAACNACKVVINSNIDQSSLPQLHPMIISFTLRCLISTTMIERN